MKILLMVILGLGIAQTSMASDYKCTVGTLNGENEMEVPVTVVKGIRISSLKTINYNSKTLSYPCGEPAQLLA
jgi:hypothetical protein